MASGSHRLLFLDPGHFHATLTLRVPHPRVADEIVVYAPEGPELRDFLALVERFNTRAAAPTRWRPVVIAGPESLARLIAERRGDVVVLAGKNGGKARTIHRLHDAGFHVLADKPWLVNADDLEHIRASLSGAPVATEIMTGRHDVAARLLKRLVDAPDVFGGFRADVPALEMESVHHLEKLVDGAPLRRPWWFFDVRVQGSGVVDIPTHLVDRAQWLAAGGLELVSVRAWPTRVPLESFRRITGEPEFPAVLASCVDGDALSYACNAELVFSVGHVTVKGGARWELSTPPGGGDTSVLVARGSRSDVRLEQSPRTGHRRRLVVEARDDRVRGALDAVLSVAQREFPGVRVDPQGTTDLEIVIPGVLDGGHEAQFALVLDRFLRTVDEGRAPTDVAARTLAKYALLRRHVSGWQRLRAVDCSRVGGRALGVAQRNLAVGRKQSFLPTKPEARHAGGPTPDPAVRPCFRLPERRRDLRDEAVEVGAQPLHRIHHARDEHHVHARFAELVELLTRSAPACPPGRCLADRRRAHPCGRR